MAVSRRGLFGLAVGAPAAMVGMAATPAKADATRYIGCTEEEFRADMAKTRDAAVRGAHEVTVEKTAPGRYRIR